MYEDPACSLQQTPVQRTTPAPTFTAPQQAHRWQFLADPAARGMSGRPRFVRHNTIQQLPGLDDDWKENGDAIPGNPKILAVRKVNHENQASLRCKVWKADPAATATAEAANATTDTSSALAAFIDAQPVDVDEDEGSLEAPLPTVVENDDDDANGEIVTTNTHAQEEEIEEEEPYYDDGGDHAPPAKRQRTADAVPEEEDAEMEEASGAEEDAEMEEAPGAEEDAEMDEAPGAAVSFLLARASAHTDS